MKKVVTIVAPAYKHEKFIEACIMSIANQDYKEKELIIIDDNSPDRTAEMIDEIIKRKSVKKCFPAGIKFVKHKENKGAHYSINEGLNMASGEYLTIINTDDLFEPNRLREMVKTLESSEAELVFSDIDTIDQDSKVLRNDEWEYYAELQTKIQRYPTINMALLTDNVAISTGNMLFTREAYKHAGAFFDYKYIHDWDFILKCTLRKEPVYTNKTKYLYRLHETNSFKELQRDVDLCYRESLEVLSNYCRNIKQGNVDNPLIPSREVWDYFIYRYLGNPDIAHIWKNC